MITKLNFTDRTIKSYAIRKLTPKECFRLMGVRDNVIGTMQSSNAQAAERLPDWKGKGKPEDIMARAVLVAQQTLARREERIKELEEQGRRQEIVIEQKDAQIDAQDKQIKIAAPKADYYDKTLASKSCMTTTQVADDLHITAHTLNRKLQEIGIIYSQSGQWHLKMPYKKWNLAGTRTYNYQSSNGEVITKVTLVWNQRGKRFILALYNNNFDVKRAIAEIKGDISNK
jgi:phage antirepressor YoqD-like protein|nr:MAG TPA: antirepressor protein [Caudoviricetes sp.]